MRRALFSVLFVFFAACRNPRDAALPKDVAGIESMKPVLEKLKPEERELVAGYLVRHTVSAAFGSAFGVKAEPIPDGTTIGKAIEEQRAFVAKQKAEEAAKKAKEEKAEAERKALAAQMERVLAVRLINLSLHQASYQGQDVSDYVVFDLEFENKSAKGISGLKGTATFKDSFGDVVASTPIKTETAVPAGATVKVRLGKEYNKFEDDDRKLANLTAATTRLEVVPQVILFDDGTKFEAPTAVD